MFLRFIKFFKPLIMDTVQNELSLSRFWFTILLFFCCYFWFFLKVEVPNSLIQIIMVVTSYLFANKGIRMASGYVEKKFYMAKQTPAVSKFKADSSQAAKVEEGDL